MGSVISLQIDSQLLPKNARFNVQHQRGHQWVVGTGYWVPGSGV